MKYIMNSQGAMLKLLIIIFIMCVCHIGMAQQIESFEKRLASLNSEAKTELNSLAFDLQPSITVAPVNARMSRMTVAPVRKGPAPKVAYIDAVNLGQVDNLLVQLNSVELLQIKVSATSDLNIPSDLSKLSKAQNLKYILIVFEYDPCGGNTINDTCIAQSLAKIKGLKDFSVPVLYQIAIPR